ncbi:MAG: peptidoglycan DD-metalloendopeptidase family protein [Rudaea sp.]
MPARSIVVAGTRVASIAIVVGFLAACASEQSAPVEDRSIRSPYANDNAQPATAPARIVAIGGTYRVQPGDTLYAIAFKHGVDFRDLASWNRIPAPYRIYVGQELRLSTSTSIASAQPTPGNPVIAPVQDRSRTTTIAPLPTTQPSRSVTAAPPPAKSQNAPMFEDVESTSAPSPTPIASAPATTPVIAPTPKPPPPVVELPKPSEPSPQLSAGGVTWHWPAMGNVIGTFVSGDQTKQGIDIAGNEGDPVAATADGEVVYSGNGLIGYGELIIIKHNASFLSAYGHNRKRLVQEGDKVKAGQRIAEMGASSAARNELHFEIRKNGKPINPLEFLPAR